MPRDETRGMKSFFEPASVAVAGVSTDQGKLGSIIFGNLLANSEKGLLKARVYALNPAHDRIGDQPCYPSIGALPETPELLIVAVPESLTPELIKEAAETGVKAAVVVTSGYAEVGNSEVERQIGRMAKRHGMRVLGPNTIGLLDTKSGVNSLFLRPTKVLPDGSSVVALIPPLSGDIAIVTQSGHLGETIAEELATNGVGIRALVGTGNQLDVSVEDVLQYLADDASTKVMAVYLEGVQDGRRFVQVAARASRKKPLVVLKIGKTEVGARAALTHTASLVGSHDVYRAAFRRAGVIEAETLQDLVDYSVALATLPRTRGKRLAIVTNAGGVGAIAADEAVKLGLSVDPMGAEAQRRLRAEFKGLGFISNASLSNPFDLTASVTTEEFLKVFEYVIGSPEYDLLLGMPTHQAPAMDYDLGRRIGDAVSGAKKPVCMCVIGSSELAGRVRREFMERGIPSFRTPERAVHALGAVSEYETLREGSSGRPSPGRRRPPRVSTKGGPLPPSEVSRLLRSYGIEEPKSVIVRSADDLDRLRKVAFPVACKLLSTGLLHKTDMGGVVVDVAGVAEARSILTRFRKLAAERGLRFDGMLVQEMVDGVELIVGGTRDPTFGPVVTLGAGGVFTELVRDYATALAPVTPKEVEVMIGETRLGGVLGGFRGGPKVAIDRLAKTVSQFSRIMADNPKINQVEVNPLIAKGRRVVAVDARAVI